MASYGFVVPVLPGMVDSDRQFMRACSVDRKAEFDASRARHGITRENVWLQETPMGTMAVVLLEADDLNKAFGGLATSQEPFDVWFRQQIQAIHGIDLSQGLPGPMNEIVLDFSR